MGNMRQVCKATQLQSENLTGENHLGALGLDLYGKII
jgi:hypothetical protein